MAATAETAALQRSSRLAARDLAGVNWDFPGRIAHSPIEGLHPYPAKFVAEIPRAVIEALGVPDGTGVLDPFCGSGTTLVESQRRGLESVGIDLNPIACLITRVKTAPAPSDLEGVALEAVGRAQDRASVKPPRIPNLDHWFLSPVQGALTSLTQAIAEAPETHLAPLRLALSSIIVRVSNQDSDTRYAAVEKNVTADDVYRLFLQAARRIHGVLEARSYDLAPAEVLEADTLTVEPRQVKPPIGLVVTSPPYPNAYEYWLYHKYRMWWLGFDPIAVKEREIGARAHFFKRNHHTEEDFARQMRKTLELVRSVLVPEGHVCFVVGNSRIHGRIVDNARIVEKAGRGLGFRRVFAAERLLSPNRKSFNLSHARIKTETVLVMQRAGTCT